MHDRNVLLDTFTEKASELHNIMMQLKESQNQSGHKGKPIDQSAFDNNSTTSKT